MDNESLISKILKSVFFKKATGKAGRYAGNASRMYGLAQDVLNKMDATGLKDNLVAVQQSVLLLVRLVKAYASGEYRGVQLKSIVAVIAVLIYFVSPIDFIPDFLPVIGIADDMALIVWLMKSLSDEILKFSEWEKNEKTIKIG